MNRKYLDGQSYSWSGQTRLHIFYFCESFSLHKLKEGTCMNITYLTLHFNMCVCMRRIIHWCRDKKGIMNMMMRTSCDETLDMRGLIFSLYLPLCFLKPLIWLVLFQPVAASSEFTAAVAGCLSLFSLISFSFHVSPPSSTL